MNITIFGIGYAGLVTGTCFAELGNEVICIDVDKKKIQKLKKGIIPIYEPGLDEMVKRNLDENRLSFSTDFKKGIEFGEVIFNAVGTPQGKDNKADLTYIFEVAKIFGRHINEYKIFVNKSTVPPGTANLCKEIIKKEIKLRKKTVRFDVVSNPEFLKEGTAIKDVLTPDRIIVGADSERARCQIESLYQPIVRTGKPLLITDIKSAEVTKYAANAFLAAKISFINEMANYCEKVGADVREVSKGIGLDSRIGPKFLQAGLGYGGSCLPKDLKALIESGKEKKYRFKLIEAIEEINCKQIEILFSKVKKHLNNLKNKKIAVWGLSFKPKTDDIRESPPIKIIKRLLGEHAIVQAFDPVAMKNVQGVFQNNEVRFAQSSYEATENADALIIATEWDEFRSVDFRKIQKLMNGNLIIDGRNIYRKKDITIIGFKYEGIGI